MAPTGTMMHLNNEKKDEDEEINPFTDKMQLSLAAAFSTSTQEDVDNNISRAHEAAKKNISSQIPYHVTQFDSYIKDMYNKNKDKFYKATKSVGKILNDNDNKNDNNNNKQVDDIDEEKTQMKCMVSCVTTAIVADIMLNVLDPLVCIYIY